MSTPTKHGTSGGRRRRRSHMALTKASFSNCIHCKKPSLSHTVCKYCGYYGETEVVDVLAKELRKQEKQKHKATK